MNVYIWNQIANTWKSFDRDHTLNKIVVCSISHVDHIQIWRYNLVLLKLGTISLHMTLFPTSEALHGNLLAFTNMPALENMTNQLLFLPLLVVLILPLLIVIIIVLSILLACLGLISDILVVLLLPLSVV